MIGFQELTRKQIYILSAALSAVLLIAVVATFRSCRPHTYPAELVAADSLCDSNADSAAVVLSRLERSGGYDGADRMYLDLLKVKLTNNLYEPQKDSTIFRVVDYFEDMGDRERLCQAYYYQGKYYKEHNDAPQALKSFQQSLKSADKDTPLSFYSKLYNQSGKIFMAQDLYDDALAMYKESFVCDSVLNDTVNMVHSLRDISQVYKHFRMFDNSEQCLKRASDILNGGCSSDIRDGLQESIQLCLAQVYRDKGDIDMAHKIFSEDLNGDVPQLMSAKYSLAIDIYSNK